MATRIDVMRSAIDIAITIADHASVRVQSRMKKRRKITMLTGYNTADTISREISDAKNPPPRMRNGT